MPHRMKPALNITIPNALDTFKSQELVADS